MIFIMDVIPALVDQNPHEARLKVTWWIMGSIFWAKTSVGSLPIKQVIKAATAFK